VIADLDTLLIALYVELTDHIIPSLGLARSGPGQRPEVTDAELVCLAVAQMLLRYDDERRWLRAAACRAGASHSGRAEGSSSGDAAGGSSSGGGTGGGAGTARCGGSVTIR
jgi:uncharacterized membrane protein YgcG